MVLSATKAQKGKAMTGARATSVTVWRLAWMPRFWPHVERSNLAHRPRASVEGMSSTRIIGKTKKDTTLQRVPIVIFANNPRRSPPYYQLGDGRDDRPTENPVQPPCRRPDAAPNRGIAAGEPF